MAMGITSLIIKPRKRDDSEVFLKSRAPIRYIPSDLQPLLQQRISGNHIYLEAGEGRPVIFCHGLFGGIFNIAVTCREIAKEYRFLMPYLPMYDAPLNHCTVPSLGRYLDSFISDTALNEAVVIGSSMGGGSSLYYALNPLNKLKGMVLCGSSGLSSIPLSTGYFKRKNYEFVKKATGDIFYDRNNVPEEMVMDVFNALQHTETVIRSIRLTKSATKTRMDQELPRIETPALLVWGKQDPVTPVEIAPVFQRLLPFSELHIIDKCGHVPTQEKPFQFLEYFFSFMKKINY